MLEQDLKNNQSLPKHTHNGVDSPKIKVVLSDVLTPQSSPSNPAGGSVVDVEGRAAIVSIISKLNSAGIFI